ncbi:Phosphoglucomutase/phosphomannomutase alpha/beta/alpha domain II [Candidatus Filomicrobium marinum]|uniref:Phosphoglucomutase/phosphomannomutase alpha/beta/alpha domain II n=2 Tax=Filomicrobium TaxID=119044 RepID=A0A0D6JJ08_9HYPH|nr:MULTISPECIES: phosphomannomutase/phosphoglucomutase [Filomicrobium]MCV0370934.1 phosphomannomutase/phosphoglucomutase [Filomicrobium sp.]CFX33603.1 Phosphoglucomutase/phosphomannomutase alpha/beta/alpha domain II [Candidatus Filomicrobium marinum]CPR21906.1 Phosphoglucomutase/phosphomannomutase alpha/beta/alpha domain II [Candidatus Filomicrobium marinum]SDP49219.1 phosphomannomutase / phosphoglucomutase [Filomicrobium insigne]
MLPKPRADLKPNTADFERFPLVKPTGFREYDARWLFPEEINLMGLNAVGLGMATLFDRRGVKKRIVVGHDYRSYSGAVKQALMTGLLAGGFEVHDIGLALSPMAYYAQFALDVEGVAMVTASHNDNGWTGIKMGLDRPLTFGPDEMSELKAIVLDGTYDAPGGGKYIFVEDMARRYLTMLTDRPKLTRPLKVVAACGNGTAGAFAPQVLEAVGCEVVPLNADLDYAFPNHNPNPEDLAMLHAIADEVKRTGADVGLAFDGDGDRCGVVDNEGHEIFADKVGVMLARDISNLHKDAKFVADVKSTGLFMTDPVLNANGATTTYWKTGHSYIKRFSHETKALVGFEKSGHFFFNPPLGRGYDDGIIAALAVCDMLDRNPDKSMADLKNDLPRTWQSPTMSPKCGDEVKYGVVDRMVAHYQAKADAGEKIAGQSVRELITVNGVRIVLEDGTWGLVRASSNKPELVIVVESPTSEANMRAIFADIDSELQKEPEVGAYNQKI